MCASCAYLVCLNPIRYTLDSTLNPKITPYTLHPAPYTLRPTPYTLNPTPLYPTPYTLVCVSCVPQICLYLNTDMFIFKYTHTK